MPEILENMAQSVLGQDFVDAQTAAGKSLEVERFWADSTEEEDRLETGRSHNLTDDEKEALNARDDPFAFVRPVPPAKVVTRGPQGHTIAPPPHVLQRSDPPSDEDYRKLVLERVDKRTRGMLFHFRVACLFVRPRLLLDSRWSLITVTIRSIS